MFFPSPLEYRRGLYKRYGKWGEHLHQGLHDVRRKTAERERMLLGIYLGNNLAEEQEYKGEYDSLKHKAKYTVDAKIEEKVYEIVRRKYNADVDNVVAN